MTATLFLENVENLFALADDKYAVMCVQHEFNPKPGLKMDGQVQTVYPRKIGQAWSSGIAHTLRMKKYLLTELTTLTTTARFFIDSVGYMTMKLENCPVIGTG